MKRFTAFSAVGVALAAALSMSAASAGDDAAKERYKTAKESCERLSGDARERCKDQVKADYKRQHDESRSDMMPRSNQQGTPSAPGPGMGSDGRPGTGQGSGTGAGPDAAP